MKRLIFCLSLLVCLSLLFAFLGGGGGGKIVDGCFVYHVKGNLVDSSKKPLANVKVITAYSDFYLFNPQDISPDSPAISYTDSAGNFQDSCSTGLSWGYTVHFGIPIGSEEAPIPPELLDVILYVEKSDGAWSVYKIPVLPGQQERVAPAERWIELGTIDISKFTEYKVVKDQKDDYFLEEIKSPP